MLNNYDTEINAALFDDLEWDVDTVLPELGKTELPPAIDSVRHLELSQLSEER